MQEEVEQEKKDRKEWQASLENQMAALNVDQGGQLRNDELKEKVNSIAKEISEIKEVKVRGPLSKLPHKRTQLSLAA